MEKRRKSNFTMLLIALLLSALMIASVVQLPWGTDIQEIPTSEVGKELLQEYWFAIILLGLLLAAGLLGGIYLAKMEAEVEEREADK